MRVLGLRLRKWMAKSYHGPDEFHDVEKTRFLALFDVFPAAGRFPPNNLRRRPV